MGSQGSESRRMKLFLAVKKFDKVKETLGLTVILFIFYSWCG